MAVGRRRSTRKAAEPKDGEPPAKKSKTTKNEENTDTNDKEETEEAAQDGDDEGEADADAAEGVTEADTDMVEKTEDKEKEKGDAKDDDDDDGRCPACPPKEKDDPPVDVEESWIGCDACKTWYHWRCVRAAHADVEDPSAFNKWYVLRVIYMCENMDVLCLVHRPRTLLLLASPLFLFSYTLSLQPLLLLLRELGVCANRV
jgi:hypothetical protein